MFSQNPSPPSLISTLLRSVFIYILCGPSGFGFPIVGSVGCVPTVFEKGVEAFTLRLPLRWLAASSFLLMPICYCAALFAFPRYWPPLPSLMLWHGIVFLPWLVCWFFAVRVRLPFLLNEGELENIRTRLLIPCAQWQGKRSYFLTVRRRDRTSRLTDYIASIYCSNPEPPPGRKEPTP